MKAKNIVDGVASSLRKRETVDEFDKEFKKIRDAVSKIITMRKEEKRKEKRRRNIRINP